MNHAVPTEAVQAFLETVLDNLQFPRHVMLVDQESFTTDAGELRMPSIIHTVSGEISQQTQRRKVPIRYEFSVRIHSNGAQHLDLIHHEIERLATRVHRKVVVQFVAAGKNNEPTFNWRILTLVIPARVNLLVPASDPRGCYPLAAGQ